MTNLTKLLLLSLCVLTASEDIFGQKIVFAQDCSYKNNPFSKKLMGSFIVEDTISDERLIIYSGAKTVNFYQTDNKWKVKKMIELPFEKKSAFSTDNFTVVSSNHNNNVWNLIVKISGDIYTAERIDMDAGTCTVAGTVFEDKKANWYGQSYTDGNTSYNIYVNRSDGFTLASIDANHTIKTFPVDFSSQLPVNKENKLNAIKDIYSRIEEINNSRSQSLYFTRRKNQFYIQPKTFCLLVSDEEPYTEMMVFDKQTGKRVRTELFSTESLLPANVKTDKVNTNALLYDGKLWMVTAYRSGGVIAAFDVETKKLIKSVTYDENNLPLNAAYGPVLYKMRPDVRNSVSEKLSEINMQNYCKEMYKERPCIYIIPLNDNEYAVNIASYALDTYLAPTSATGDRIRGGSTFYSDPTIYNSAALGLIVNKSTAEIQSRKSSFNEINQTAAGKSYSRIEMDYKGNDDEPEYRNKRSYVMNTQRIRDKVYTIYYYDNQLKVSAKQNSSE
jgi:hypothetical protein